MTDRTGQYATLTASAGTVFILLLVLYLFVGEETPKGASGGGEMTGITVTGIIAAPGTASGSPDVLPEKKISEAPESETTDSASAESLQNSDREAENTAVNRTDTDKSSESDVPVITDKGTKSAVSVKNNAERLPKPHSTVTGKTDITTKSEKTSNHQREKPRRTQTGENTATATVNNSSLSNGAAAARTDGSGTKTASSGVEHDGQDSHSGAADSENYQKAYGALLARARELHSYPYQARRRGIEGRGILRVTINSQGQVTKTVIIKGTGSKVLDRAMEELGEKLTGFDTGIRGLNLQVNIPLVYKLTGNR